MGTRAAVVLLEDSKVALIERRRDGHHYFLFPGGRVEAHESPTEAAAREAREELGLTVTMGAHIATIEFDGNRQLYFLAQASGGIFGSGKGEEMSGYDFEGDGSYVAVWKSVEDLDKFDVRPRSIVDMIRSGLSAGWPNEPRLIREA